MLQPLRLLLGGHVVPDPPFSSETEILVDIHGLSHSADPAVLLPELRIDQASSLLRDLMVGLEVLLALGVVVGRLIADLDKGKEYVVHCKMGGRSAKAVTLMLDRGFNNVKNLTGGIQDWIEEIDPSQTTY